MRASTPACGRKKLHHAPPARRRRLACNAQDGSIVDRFQDQLRLLPLVAGATGFAALTLNRAASGIAPVVDAGSSQSRADVLVIAMAATLALTGFQWLSLKPSPPEQVEPIGKPISYVRAGLKPVCKKELEWAWDALSAATCCRCLVVIHSGSCMLQAGLAAADARQGSVSIGSICEGVMKSGKANYLANLALFPGRFEFAEFLPDKLSCAIIAPIGNAGVMIAGGDMQRGFSKLDQAWITNIADKLDDSLASHAPSGIGFK